ncbi:MAG: hypothetical protein GWN07_13975, partial [Actinobacteria bacterium]|nr:hypothetical protein [Actinomycetota bacterium]NIS31462.1 hypothetical protein [Actinomycetota bacterium]NIU66580.1 hypothetical protein [Actinomycetota bacterium]NIV87281.1 hypothetical protein [Actinomycetota bacterium]NIW28384.1 hypothetical protein [Actinomycetota bacterium]
LAGVLGAPVTLESGGSGRRKTFRVSGVSAAETAERITAEVGGRW